MTAFRIWHFNSQVSIKDTTSNRSNPPLRSRLPLAFKQQEAGVVCIGAYGCISTGHIYTIQRLILSYNNNYDYLLDISLYKATP